MQKIDRSGRLIISDMCAGYMSSCHWSGNVIVKFTSERTNTQVYKNKPNLYFIAM